MADDKNILIEVDINVDKSIKDQIKLKKSIDEQKKDLIDLKNTVGENSTEYIKANATLKATTDELKNNERMTYNAIKANQQNEGSISQLRSQLSLVSAQWAKLSKDERENTEAGKVLSKQKLQLTERLKAEEKATGDTRRNVGNYSEALKGLSPKYAALSNNAEGFVSSIKKFGPVGAAIGIGIAALGAAFTAFFTKTDEGAELLERKLNGLKAATNVLVGELARAGKALVSGITEPGKEAEKVTGFLSKSMRVMFGVMTLGGSELIRQTDTWKNITKRMGDAQTAAEKYTKIQQELEDAEIAMIVPRAESNKKIAESKLLYEDETKTIKERIGALKESLDLEIETVQKEIDYQNKVIANIETINAEKKKAGMFNEQDEKKLQEAIAKRIQLETESMMKQRKLQSTLNSATKELNKKAQEEKKKLLDEELKWKKELADKSIEAMNYEIERRKSLYDEWQEYQKTQEDIRIEREILNYENTLAASQDNIFKTLNLERAGLDAKEKQEIEYAQRIGANQTAIHDKYAQARKEIDKAEADAKFAVVSELAGNIASALGESSALGKAAAIAQTTISTYQGASQAFASASVFPPPAGQIIGAAAAAAVVANGLANVKKILSVKTPGKSSGGGSANISSSGSAPTVANVNPQIGQGIVSRDNSQLGNTNQIKLTPTLVQDDVTSAQKKDNMKTKIATI